MGGFEHPVKVRLFTGLMYGVEDFFQQAVSELQTSFGRVALKSTSFDFDFTEYYAAEMGPGLKKIFLGFEELVDPGELANIKCITNNIEERLSSESAETIKRPVNIDPGYVSQGKVVLASTKNRSQRIYLDKGVYAEVTLLVKKDRCEPLAWTYPDFRTALAHDFFLSLRNL